MAAAEAAEAVRVACAWDVCGTRAQECQRQAGRRRQGACISGARGRHICIQHMQLCAASPSPDSPPRKC